MRRLLVLGAGAAFLSFGADRGLVSLIGPDAQTVAGVQMDNVRNTSLGQLVLQRLPFQDAEMQRFIKDSGFDPRRDLREVVVGQAQRQDGSLLAIRGTYDMAKIAALVKRENATLSKYQGYDVISHGESHWVAFVEPTVAIMGNANAVKAALARRQSAGGALSADMIDRIDRVSGANDAWFVSNAGVPAGFAAPPPAGPAGRRAAAGPMQALNALQQASGGVRLGSTVQFSVDAVAKSEKDATALADVVRMFAAMAGDQQMGNKSGAEFQTFAALIDKVQVQSSGTSVRLMLPVPQAQAEQWLQEMTKPRPAAPAAVRKRTSY